MCNYIYLNLINVYSEEFFNLYTLNMMIRNRLIMNIVHNIDIII